MECVVRYESFEDLTNPHGYKANISPGLFPVTVNAKPTAVLKNSKMSVTDHTDDEHAMNRYASFEYGTVVEENKKWTRLLSNLDNV